ncbi:MAG: oligosaccharide flippase family protein [Limnochordaceae bacterium]|nr:oligosaccharide flippase family protein [Limnochordaceae bacterium]
MTPMPSSPTPPTSRPRSRPFRSPGQFLRRRPLVRGALSLTAVAILNRAIGMIYRVLLARRAGAQVLGLWEMTGPLERVAALTATLGLPISLSQVVATAAARGDHARARAASRLALQLLLAATGLTCLVIALAAEPLGRRFLADARAIDVFRLYPLILIPSVLASWLRAYTQGYQSMLPTAFAQLAEQLVRVPAVLILLSWFLPGGAARGAQAIAVGTAAGELAGLLLLVALVRSRHAGLPCKAAEPAGIDRLAQLRPPGIVRSPVGSGLWRELFSLGASVVASQAYGAIFSIVYLNMIPQRLVSAGIPQEQFATLYGQLSGMVLPLLYLPMVFVNPLVRVLLPAAADAWERQATHRLRRLLTLSLLTALTLGVGTWLVATTRASWMISLLYGPAQVGAARYLTLLSWAAPFVFTYHVLVAVLYGMGQTLSVVSILVSSTVARYAVTWHLAALPGWGFDGVVAGILVDDILSPLLAAVVLGVTWYRRLRRSDPRPSR